MRVLMMTGDAPRHTYLVSQVAKAGLLAGHLIEKREPFVPKPPKGISDHLGELFVTHFNGRAESEQRFFGEAETDSSLTTLKVDRAELNSSKTIEFIRQGSFDAVVSYGVHKLEPDVLDCMPPIRWNTHGGLSPWYRGVATMFWPSYMLEPQKTGVTLHELTARIDAGPIVHQSVPQLIAGDGIHDLANRAVATYAEELPKVLELQFAGKLKTSPQKQKSAGKLWLGHDWRPEHLRLIYDVFDNRIVDRYLEGDFQQEPAQLIRQF